jgi:septal ring factor EnvC (AmiA/AmiB activator)
VKLPAAIAPYALALKWGLIALLCLGFLGVGCSWQKARDAGTIEKLRGEVGRKSDALRAASDSLAATAEAIRKQNAENERRRKGAEAEAKRLEDAREAARAALARIETEHNAEREKWERARRARPDCDALLKTDIYAACGVRLQ